MKRCLCAGALFLLASCSVLGRFGVREPNVLFFDDFRDNRHGWLIEDTDRTRSDIEHGDYVIVKKGRRGISSRTVDFGPDLREDFVIEAVIKKREGYDDFGYGMIWGCRNTQDTYKFLITGEGRYLYGRTRYSDWKGMDGFQTSSAVHTGNATNRLALKKVGSRLSLLINGSPVYETDFEAFSPNNVGFTLEDSMKIEVKRLVIRRLVRKQDRP